MVIKGVGRLKLAVAGFTLGRDSGGPLARILHEIEVTDDCVDVALAKIGELLCVFGAIGTSERIRQLGFEFREIRASEVFGGGQSWARILIFSFRILLSGQEPRSTCDQPN